jgi:hypothetical protein
VYILGLIAWLTAIGKMPSQFAAGAFMATITSLFTVGAVQHVSRRAGEKAAQDVMDEFDKRTNGGTTAPTSPAETPHERGSHER